MATNNPQPVHFFASNLKFLLKRFGVNQIELAQYMNRQQTSVSNWINGISVPDVDDLVKIHHFFGFGMDALILMDLSKSQLVTDKYIASFQKNRAAEFSKNMIQEPEIALGRTLLDQLKQMDGKLDKMASKLGGKG